MKVVLLFVSCLMAAITLPIVYFQTDGFRGCPLNIGDKVDDGTVIAKRSFGSITPNCKVAVKYNDGSVSESYEYAWRFQKQEKSE